ncbi:MAG: NAD(+)/NADH kinase [Actinomycetota bacterium]|nr:NAD(+)/NADH kinase [Actinomycetota bacterium]
MTEPVTVGVIANPLSGRDVRRVAARGGVTTSQDKRNRIARAVVGAVTGGAERIVVMAEPFRIATGAIADLHLDCEYEVLDIQPNLSPHDSEKAALAMREMSVETVIVLGGDGTNRTITKVWPDVTLAPMSTGTNNVFPSMAEATVIGAAAGLVASGQIDRERVAPQVKVVRATTGKGDDLALIDAAHLVDDFVGNRMPYEPDTIRTIVMSRAEPASIGVSSIGGLTMPCSSEADHGVLVRCGPGGRPLRAPVAPGLYRTVHVLESRELPIGEIVEIPGPGIIAYDGDRETRLGEGDVTLTVRRDGPCVIDVEQAMAIAATEELFMTSDAAAGDAALM